jgi:hypothetical protein
MVYEIDTAQRLVRWTHRGAEAPGTWTHTLDEILADPAFRRGFNILEDLRTDPTVPTTADVNRGANAICARQHLLGRCRWAVVVTAKSPAYFGMLRMASLLLDTSMIVLRPFTDPREAFDWVAPRPAR